MKNTRLAQIEGLKNQTFGVEVEMNAITRRDAARAAAEYFGTGRYEETAYCDGYCTWSAFDAQGRKWKFSRDVSIAGPDSQKCEMVTPVLKYEDLELLQGLIRHLRANGAKSSASRGCGVHIHIGSDGHTPQTIRNLVNMMYAHEDQLAVAIELDRVRCNTYCKVVDHDFLKRLNKAKPKTNEELARCWYNGPVETCHYSHTRYRMLNLHAYFNRYHTIEFRLFQFDDKKGDRKGGLHAGQLKAMIQFCLALSELAKELKTVACKKATVENVDAFRSWLVRLGLIGEEFKTCRDYFCRNFMTEHEWREHVRNNNQAA